MPGAASIAISTACLSGTLEDKLHAAASAGFTGIELLEHDLVMSAWDPERIAREAAVLGLSIVAYQPLHVETVRPERFARLHRLAERKIELAARLGAGVVVCCASRTDDGVDDEHLAADQWGRLADLAASRAVRLAFEPVPWGRIRSYEDAGRIVAAVDHPALGLCLDSFHLLARRPDGATAGGVDSSRVFHVQLADGERDDLDVRERSLHHRLFPGQGSLPVADLLGGLLADGYRGTIALEVFNDVYQQEDPRHAATDAMRAVRALAEETAGMSSPLDLAPAPAPALQGIATVELAVDEISGPLVAGALTALGFASARDGSEGADLWTQGEAAILLDSSSSRWRAPGAASITGLVIDTPEPAAAARRAGDLLAPVVDSRVRRADETTPTIAAPDGTFVVFRDGRRARPSEARSDGAAISRIDYVSMTQSVDDFDQSTLFYGTLLGLETTHSTEITAPFGLVRSWSAADPTRRVRLALSTTPLRRGDWAPAVPSPQYVALATDDAITCARSTRERGGHVLEIPQNYYDDLDARTELPAGMLDDLRAHSVLYDRDDRGEFLHFFTEIVGTRIFFEVVQRLSGYDGIGSPRTIPLRMAAHRRQRMRVLGGAPDTDTGRPRHDYSLAHLTALSLSPPELVDAAAAAGYRYVGLRMTKVTPQEPHYPLASDPALMRATKTHLAATGVEVLDIELARITSGDSPRDYLRFLDAGAELGARHVIAQLPDADFARKADRFAELCELAAPLGLTVDLEFPSWTETPDLSGAVRVLREADQPNAGLLIDVLHFARSGSDVAELRSLPREWFHYAHVCDAPAEIPDTTTGLIHTARFERLFPGEGGIDIPAILEALPAQIPYALEIPRAMLVAQVGAKEHARQAIAAARRHLG